MLVVVGTLAAAFFAPMAEEAKRPVFRRLGIAR
jgi:hypothetical protein